MAEEFAPCPHLLAVSEHDDGRRVEHRCGDRDPDHRHLHWVQVPCDCEVIRG